MRALARIAVSAVATAAAVVALATPSNAAFLPVGAGVWGPSTNVAGSSGCAGPDTGDCHIEADSKMTGTPGLETCNNATYVVQQPVIIGTDFGCNVTFSALVTLTGSGAEAGADPVDVETGACAGLTLSDAELWINDAATGEYSVGTRVVVTPSGWKIEGSFVSANAGSLEAYVLHVAGKITPACTLVKVASGDTLIYFSGTFQGSYQFV